MLVGCMIADDPALLPLNQPMVDDTDNGYGDECFLPHIDYNPSSSNKVPSGSESLG